MSGIQVQAGIVTKLEDEGSECGTRRQAMVLQVSGSIPMGPWKTQALSSELRLQPQNSYTALGDRKSVV